MVLSPILTVANTIELAPINTLLPISIFLTLEYPDALFVLPSCVKSVAFTAIVTSFPMLMRKSCPASILRV